MNITVPDFCRHYGSHVRPSKVLSWINEVELDLGENEMAEVFWPTMMRYWSGFDLIPHDDYAVLFWRYRFRFQYVS